MKDPSVLHIAMLMVICLLAAVIGLYAIGRFKTLFRGYVRNEWLRQNLVTWVIVFCFFIALGPINVEFFQLLNKGILYLALAEFSAETVNVLFVFNIVRSVVNYRGLKRLPFGKQRIIILLTLIAATVIFNLPLNYIAHDFSTRGFKYSALWSVYMASVTGLVYIMMSYLDAERNRKFQEKELELAKMNELKTKAELDALHSKVNPHFLYNALNSIADLSVTDGRKARQMTIALADLFRYSINYSDNNYATVKDEVEMTNAYLQIEKIRFEDKLNYTVEMEEEVYHYLVPRFILQPLVENAVKHGLKATGQVTQISLSVKKDGAGLVMQVADTGPPFPAGLNPGYGVKSVYDKLDLLFPDNYEIYFSNHPVKQVSVHIHKLLKNEPVV